RDPAPAARVGDGAVLGELRAIPQGEDAPRCLEEDHVIAGIGAGAPPHRLIEGPGAGQIRDAERDQAQPLLHRPILACPCDLGKDVCENSTWEMNPTSPSTHGVRERRYGRPRGYGCITSAAPSTGSWRRA